ncbi:MAG: hypothetical protein M1820_008143 [Bogoriella megaspora]|nr:MAG: hypothetical protein M1820_008143 [Bogoriella megaspora]
MTSSTSSNLTLVNIGTHSLALYTHGPEPRSYSEPVILFISGIGCSSLNWTGVTRLLSPTLRSYTYDRSGYRNSEPSPHAPTGENIALELTHLIKNTPIPNPLIIVGHSWAGVLINEFIAIPGDVQRVAGLVLVDANHETALQVLDPNDASLEAISEGVDHYSAKGIAAEHKLTKEEWEAYVRDEATEKHKLQGQAEDDEYVSSFSNLLKKGLANRQPLLGDKPVYVIGGSRKRDWSGVYRAGVEKGNGTEEQRAYVRELIATADEKSAGLMREHLKLSTKGELIFADKSGHFVQLTQPEIVADGVNWVLDELQKSS